MARRTQEEAVRFQVAGPDRYKVLAALEGSDPLTRVSLTDSDVTVTLEGDGNRLILGGRKKLPCKRATLMYLVSGTPDTVMLYDALIKYIETMVTLEGIEEVSRRLASALNEGPLQRPTPTSKTGSSPAAPPPGAAGVASKASTAPDDPTADAARRWAERKAAMLRQNDHATGPELGRLVGSRARNIAERASSWRRKGRVFAVNDGSRVVYPLFQIKDDKPHPLVSDVIGLLRPKLSDWQIFAWFTAPDTWACEGRPPKDLLDEDPESVREAARHAVAEVRD